MIKKLLLLLFILSTLSYSAHSQDDARLGATFAKTIRLGPATYDFGGENQYEGYKFGVEYMKRFSDKGRYAFNLSYATYDLEINKVTGSI